MTASDRPPPESADLGERVEVFKPMPGNIVAGFIISALLVGGGAAAAGFPLRGAALAGWQLPVEAKAGWCWLAVGIMCVVGLVLLACGVGLALYCKGLISHRVEVFTNGFRYCAGRDTDDVAWAQVAHIRETILYERHPILKGPAKLLLPKVASASYAVVTAAGKEYGFDGNSIKGITRFGGVLRAQADRHAVAWETVEEHA